MADGRLQIVDCRLLNVKETEVRSQRSDVRCQPAWRLASAALALQFFAYHCDFAHFFLVSWVPDSLLIVQRFFKYWLPVLIWLGLIFIGSTDLMSAEHTSRFLVPFLRWLDPRISLAAIDAIQLIIRKLGHVVEYAILAALLWRAVRGGTNLCAKMSILFMAVWFACAIFAASDEFHQSFVPSRTAVPWDVMIDSGGAIFGLLISRSFTRRKPGEVSKMSSSKFTA